MFILTSRLNLFNLTTKNLYISSDMLLGLFVKIRNNDSSDTWIRWFCNLVTNFILENSLSMNETENENIIDNSKKNMHWVCKSWIAVSWVVSFQNFDGVYCFLSFCKASQSSWVFVLSSFTSISCWYNFLRSDMTGRNPCYSNFNFTGSISVGWCDTSWFMQPI